ncbi:hypothetical protein BRPE64_ACDS14430 [Caballeronia insecticola]|uniref:Uncharacterized protein n=1 Tax=Caballeronia insecticola TaxID=758793 RepID=R4WYC5_9BURK|nr:hypothetical protein BRPE64_ACDS14430 [Caballeronia insecticola]
MRCRLPGPWLSPEFTASIALQKAIFPIDAARFAPNRSVGNPAVRVSAESRRYFGRLLIELAITARLSAIFFT